MTAATPNLKTKERHRTDRQQRQRTRFRHRREKRDRRIIDTEITVTHVLQVMNCKTGSFISRLLPDSFTRIETLRTAHNFHKQHGQLGTKIDLLPDLSEKELREYFAPRFHKYNLHKKHPYTQFYMIETRHENVVSTTDGQPPPIQVIFLASWPFLFSGAPSFLAAREQRRASRLTIPDNEPNSTLYRQPTSSKARGPLMPKGYPGHRSF